MDEFELRPAGEGWELKGGKLDKPMQYGDGEGRDAAIRVVGFLSQLGGSVLRIFDAEGNEVETQRREASGVSPGAVGGLSGPK